MSKTDKKRLVLLDTHAILHRAYHALPELSSSKGEPTGALYGLIAMLVRIITDLGPDYIVAAYDLPGATYRHDAFDGYKAKRAKTEDALAAQINRARDVLKAFGIPLYEQPGFEADDVIGTIVEKVKHKHNLEIIIASGDMDTLQLVSGDKVRVYTLRKGLTDTALYDEDAVKGRYGFGPELLPDYKGFRGDPSDNIPGIAGVGEKTATTLVSQFGSVEDVYKTLEKHPDWFEKAGIKGKTLEKIKEGREAAEFSKMLGTIHRDAPIDFTLPDRTWKEGADSGQALDMLAEFEFRSLVPRVRQVLGGSSSGSSTSEKVPTSLTPGQPGFFSSAAASAEDIPEADLQKVLLAVSVLDSNIAKPDIEDIYRMGKSREFAEASKAILADIKEKELEFVYEKIELPLMPVLRAMEKCGVKIDREFLKKLSKEYTKELETLASRIYKHAGGPFNINSPKQLGEVLFDKLGIKPERQKKTPTGARSTREAELLKMKHLHPIIEDVLAYRELQKLLSTYIDNLPTLVDSEDRVHTTFIQMGAATGRLATQNPGLQNIPIKTELGRAIRKAFVAGEGCKLVAFDYSQIELRIAAWLSGDPGLIEIFKNGRDVHAEVASRVFHVDPERVTYDQRRIAKVINFGILYGMGVNALRESLGSTRAEAQEFYNQYFEAFPRLAAYIDEVKGRAAADGYTTTFFGRRRYFDGIHSPIPYVRAAAERMAINAPMQGTQADIIKLAMVRIDDMLKKEGHEDGAHLLLQVHDELVFEIEDKKVDELAPKIKEIMETIVPANDRRNVPIIAEGKVGENWGEMKKLNI
jgi:DNA polymerase-1